MSMLLYVQVEEKRKRQQLSIADKQKICKLAKKKIINKGIQNQCRYIIALKHAKITTFFKSNMHSIA
jgi:hypothetical protein